MDIPHFLAYRMPLEVSGRPAAFPHYFLGTLDQGEG